MKTYLDGSAADDLTDILSSILCKVLYTKGAELNSDVRKIIIDYLRYATLLPVIFHVEVKSLNILR